jgi:alkylhydroperoxidase/carboxymuconolactone decarboxylase family protein YurZ
MLDAWFVADDPGTEVGLKSAHQELLRRLTLSDEIALTDVMAGRFDLEPGLEERTRCLVRLAGLIALDAKTSLLHAATEAAFAAGAKDEEIVEVMAVVAPIVGSIRMTAVIPRMRTVLDRD